MGILGNHKPVIINPLTFSWTVKTNPLSFYWPTKAKTSKMKMRWGPNEDSEQNRRYWEAIDARNFGQYCLVLGEEWLKWVGP